VNSTPPPRRHYLGTGRRAIRDIERGEIVLCDVRSGKEKSVVALEKCRSRRPHRRR